MRAVQKGKFFKRTILSCGLWASAFFAVSVSAYADAAQDLVIKLSNGQVKVVSEFNSIGNLKGFVVEPTQAQNKAPSIVYADKDGRYLVSGTIVSAAGNNVSQDDYNKQIASVKAPTIYLDATKTNWVQQGSDKAPHKAYIMIEPNCIACHMLYNGLKPYLDSGQLAVRWILVSFMRPQSDGMVAAIMQSKDVSAAMSQDEKGFDVKTETGGIKPIAVSSDVKSKIKQNMDFMLKSNFAGTPAIIFKTTQGSYQIIPGFLAGAALKDAVNNMASSF